MISSNPTLPEIVKYNSFSSFPAYSQSTQFNISRPIRSIVCPSKKSNHNFSDIISKRNEDIMYKNGANFETRKVDNRKSNVTPAADDRVASGYRAKINMLLPASNPTTRMRTSFLVKLFFSFTKTASVTISSWTSSPWAYNVIKKSQ